MGGPKRSPRPPPPPRRPREWIDGRYELLEVAGRGGMAMVWRARHHGPGRFRRLVALKQMHPHLAKLAVYRDLFEEEARIGSVLVDPNIAQVFDFVEDRGQYYLVMEWVSGIDLATYIRYVVDRCEDRLRWGAVAAIETLVRREFEASAGVHSGKTRV